MRKLNVTDRQMEGGRCYISRPGHPAPREIKKVIRPFLRNQPFKGKVDNDGG